MLAVLAVLVGGFTARAEPTEPPLLFPRCENVLPGEVRQRFFTGWKAEEKQDCPDCAPVCSFTHAKSRSQATVAYVCGGRQNTEAEMRQARAEDEGTELPGVGRYAYRSIDEGWASVDAWDDDSPCVLVVQWKGKDQQHQVVELARAVVTATTRERVERPVLDALVWTLARVTGGQVPGLPAGQRALVLGYCGVTEDTAVLEWLQTFFPGMRSVRVELSPQEHACPQPLEGVRKVDARTTKVGSQLLTVALYQQPVGDHQMRYVQLASLADASGGLLDTFAAEPITSQVALRRADEPHCVNSLKSGVGKLMATSVCEWDPSGCRRKGVDRYTRTFSATAGTIRMQQERTGSKPDCSTGD